MPTKSPTVVLLGPNYAFLGTENNAPVNLQGRDRIVPHQGATQTDPTIEVGLYNAVYPLKGLVTFRYPDGSENIYQDKMRIGGKPRSPRSNPKEPSPKTELQEVIKSFSLI
jgi:hypothetical protein